MCTSKRRKPNKTALLVFMYYEKRLWWVPWIRLVLLNLVTLSILDTATINLEFDFVYTSTQQIVSVFTESLVKLHETGSLRFNFITFNMKLAIVSISRKEPVHWLLQGYLKINIWVPYFQKATIQIPMKIFGWSQRQMGNLQHFWEFRKKLNFERL